MHKIFGRSKGGVWFAGMALLLLVCLALGAFFGKGPVSSSAADPIDATDLTNFLTTAHQADVQKDFSSILNQGTNTSTEQYASLLGSKTIVDRLFATNGGDYWQAVQPVEKQFQNLPQEFPDLASSSKAQSTYNTIVALETKSTAHAIHNSYDTTIDHMFTAVLTGSASPSQSNDPSTSQQSNLPAHFFAPYAMPGEGDSLKKVEQTTGQKYFTLAFVTSSGNSCKAEGVSSSGGDIAFLRSQGGDVIQSFGGAGSTELAQTCTSVSSLQAQYQSVIDKTKVTHLDFDIEEGREDDASSYTRRNSALVALQKANPGLTISFTLPAGSQANGKMGLLKDAVAKGVVIDKVNIMTMDYGVSSKSVSDESIDTIQTVFSRLKGLYPSKTSDQVWGMIGMTVLIGQSDNKGEVFTIDDGAKILSFAKEHQIGELSLWAISRDNGSCPGNQSDLNTCDGLSQAKYTFTNSWKSFTSK